MTFYTRKNLGYRGEVNQRDGKWVARVHDPDGGVTDLGEHPDSLHAIAAVDNHVAAFTTKRESTHAV